MPRWPRRAVLLAALLVPAPAALADGAGTRARGARLGPRGRTRVPEPAGLPLTLSGLALLALANRYRLAARTAPRPAVAAEAP